MHGISALGAGREALQGPGSVKRRLPKGRRSSHSRSSDYQAAESPLCSGGNPGNWLSCSSLTRNYPSTADTELETVPTDSKSQNRYHFAASSVTVLCNPAQTSDHFPTVTFRGPRTQSCVLKGGGFAGLIRVTARLRRGDSSGQFPPTPLTGDPRPRPSNPLAPRKPVAAQAHSYSEKGTSSKFRLVTTRLREWGCTRAYRRERGCTLRAWSAPTRLSGGS